MNRLSIIGIVLFLTIAHGFAQTDIFRSLPVMSSDSNKANLRIERNISTYVWNLNSAVMHMDSLFSFRAADQFTSSLIHKNFNSFRDENTLGMDIAYTMTEQISLNGETHSFVASDNQSLGVSKAAIHSLLGGISYRPFRNTSLTPLIGLRYDKQQGEEDEGAQYRIVLYADSLDFSGYSANFSGEFNQSDLHPRKFNNNGADLTIASTFSEGASDSIHLHWYSNRWDFYIPADVNIKEVYGVQSNIRSRNEQMYTIQNILDYNFGYGFSTEFVTSIESRIIDNKYRYKILFDPQSILFNTNVQEFRLGGGIDIRYRSEVFSSLIGLHVSERDEKHSIEKIDNTNHALQETRARQESQLDNTALKTTLSETTTARLSSADDAVFDGSISILRYDTPDSNNTDDRDELLINLSLKERHTFNHVFEGRISAEAILSHIVYLHGEKSANNNWNRIFRLSPEVEYRPSDRFRMFNSFEVLANYTVFDFETLVPSVKSYSYRQVAFLDSTSYDISRTLGLDMFGHLRIYERGEFSWKDFSERPQQYVEEITFSPQVRYHYTERWLFAIGFRSFAQKRFRYEKNIRRFENTYLSAGPTARISIHLSPDSLIEINGWKEFQRNSGENIRDYSNVMMNIKYFF